MSKSSTAPRALRRQAHRNGGGPRDGMNRNEKRATKANSWRPQFATPYAEGVPVTNVPYPSKPYVKKGDRQNG